jgi:hydroxyacylglutathione hydrolase
LNQLSTAIQGTAQLDPERTVAVHCKGGYRSAIAASLLRRAGFRQVVNVSGGFDAWKAAGLPVAEIAVA